MSKHSAKCSTSDDLYKSHNQSDQPTDHPATGTFHLPMSQTWHTSNTFDHNAGREYPQNSAPRHSEKFDLLHQVPPPSGNMRQCIAHIEWASERESPIGDVGVAGLRNEPAPECSPVQTLNPYDHSHPFKLSPPPGPSLQSTPTRTSHCQCGEPSCFSGFMLQNPRTPTGVSVPDLSLPGSGKEHDAKSPVLPVNPHEEMGLGTSAARLRLVKPVVASDKVVEASARRRLPTSPEQLIHCTVPSCTSTFTSRHNFKNHIRSHLGEKEFKCGYCSYEAVTKSDIKRHFKSCKSAKSSFDDDYWYA